MNFIVHSCMQGEGKWPRCDAFGTPFSEQYHPQRASMAGKDLANGWKAALAGFQGDQDFLHKIFKFKSDLTTSCMSLTSCRQRNYVLP